MTVTIEDLGLENNRTSVRDKGEVCCISRAENERPKIDSSNGNESKRIDAGRVRYRPLGTVKSRGIFVVSGFVSLFGGCIIGDRNRLNFGCL